MRFRPHRGSRVDAEAEAVALVGLPALLDHLRAIHPSFGPAFDPSTVRVEHYHENHWIVIDKPHWGVAGFIVQGG
jgi:hypothetical protein